MDVESNLFLGGEINRRQWWYGWLLDKAAMRREAREHIASLKVGLRSVRQPVGVLSGGQRQSVAVARAISWAAGSSSWTSRRRHWACANCAACST